MMAVAETVPNQRSGKQPDLVSNTTNNVPILASSDVNNE
jgi:hypothetical protein